jgi:hypothetical protein
VGDPSRDRPVPGGRRPPTLLAAVEGEDLARLLGLAGRDGATGWSLWAADHPALGPTKARR